MTTTASTITYNIPTVSAKTVLETLYSTASAHMDAINGSFAWANMFIPMADGTLAVEVWIDSVENTVSYMVALNADENTDIPVVGYTTAIRTLRQLLAANVAF